MKTIQKIYLDRQRETQIVELPFNSRVLSVHGQHDKITVFYHCETDNKIKEQRTFHTFYTGDPLPELLLNINFIGTVIIGNYVYHVFEGVIPQ